MLPCFKYHKHKYNYCCWLSQSLLMLPKKAGYKATCMICSLRTKNICVLIPIYVNIYMPRKKSGRIYIAVLDSS